MPNEKIFIQGDAIYYGEEKELIGLLLPNITPTVRDQLVSGIDGLEPEEFKEIQKNLELHQEFADTVKKSLDKLEEKTNG